MDGVPSMSEDHIVRKLTSCGVKYLQQRIAAITEIAKLQQRQALAKGVSPGNSDLLTNVAQAGCVCLLVVIDRTKANAEFVEQRGIKRVRPVQS